MELVPYDWNAAMEKLIFEVWLFLERMKTAVPYFDPALQKQVDMSRIDAAAGELKIIITHVMKTGEPLVPPDPERSA